jgi:Ca2+-transporting ATPase
MRDPSAGPLDNDVTRNSFVWLALLLCAALLVGSAYVPVLSTVLELEPPEPLGWVVTLVLALLPLLAGEATRLFASAVGSSSGTAGGLDPGQKGEKQRADCSWRHYKER